jgi:shikimate dehydrogenase
MAPKPKAYAVLGDPVAHSLSPQLFDWLFGQFGVDAKYLRLRVRPHELPGAVQRVRAGELQGASVTLPHKEATCALVEELDPTAREMGACNCLILVNDGRVRGCNTDAAGFRQALTHHGATLADARVLVLGCGGAGRAVAFAAATSGARKVMLANRTRDRAERLSKDLVSTARAGSVSQFSVAVLPLTTEGLSAALEESDIVVNATSVGLMSALDDPLPRGCVLSAHHTVLDMVYRPLQTSLLMRATRAGGMAVDGLWMLLYQAFEQLKLWTGLVVSSGLAERAHDFLRGEAA